MASKNKVMVLVITLIVLSSLVALIRVLFLNDDNVFANKVAITLYIALIIGVVLVFLKLILLGLNKISPDSKVTKGINKVYDKLFGFLFG